MLRGLEVKKYYKEYICTILTFIFGIGCLYFIINYYFDFTNYILMDSPLGFWFYLCIFLPLAILLYRIFEITLDFILCYIFKRGVEI